MKADTLRHDNLILVLGLVATLCGAPTAQQTAHAQGSSIVDITAHTTAGNRHSCGFVVRSEGLIATNLSYLSNLENLTIRFPNGESTNEIFIYAIDVPHDLVVLQLPAANLIPLTLGDSAALHTGATVQTTCCGFDPMCASQSTEVTGYGVHEIGVTLIHFASPPIPWMGGSPILNTKGEVVGIANILQTDQSKIGIASNDISAMLQNPLPTPVTLAAFIEYVNSLPPGDGSEGTPQNAEPAAGNNPQQQGWSMAGSWRVPNLDFIFMFVEDQGQLKGKEIFETGGSTESFFILDKLNDTQYKGFHHFLWGCSTKKSALAKWKSKTCQVDWETTLEQLGPDYAVLEYEGFVDGLPKPGDKAFRKVCETCGSDLAKKKIRYEISRTQ